MKLRTPETKIKLEWNTYKEGFKKVQLGRKLQKKFEDLDIQRTNSVIWRINKAFDRILMKKVEEYFINLSENKSLTINIYVLVMRHL